MDFSTDFYRDEVRYGFYVPTAIKQAWAAELMVLSEIDRICQKYNIKYYAEWGTMLGAIRHAGFVPWDDDLDIGMLREDYVRFGQAAQKELPKEYAIHNYETKENHWLFMSRVLNRNQICFDEEHLKKYHNFPYIASVDIFVLDYLYKDEKKEKERCDEIKFILALADLIEQKGIDDAAIRLLNSIEQKYHIKISDISSTRKIEIELYRLAEKQMARVPRREADCLGQIFPWVLKGNKGMPKEYYDKMVRLPFENTTIPIPADYHTVMQERFGNYMKIRKVWDGHDYPFFEGQRSNLQAMADFKLPEFTFSQDMLKGRNNNKTEDNRGLKDFVTEYMTVMDELMNSFEIQAVQNKHMEDYDILPECQQLAVDLGTMIENVKGENNPNVMEIVSEIEVYCEVLYKIYGVITDKNCNLEHREFTESAAELKSAYEAVKKAVNEKLLSKKVILFVTTGLRQWEGFRNLCETEIADKTNEVYGILVPVAFKDVLGRATFEDAKLSQNMDFFPEETEVRMWKDIDLSLLKPDIIYIQDPYDNENPCLTIPPYFYAENLRKYADTLIYVPAFYVNEFCENDLCDVYNMKYYVTAPAIIHADLVLMQSENTKSMYIKKLVGFSGEETYDYWDKKLKVTKLYDDKKLPKFKEVNDKKSIVYCIGENEVADKKEAMLKEIKERLETFAKNSSKYNLKICIYPPDLEVWEETDSSLIYCLTKLIEEYTKQEWCERCDMNTAKWDDIVNNSNAYYGSPSPLVHMFAMMDKPVMISK